MISVRAVVSSSQRAEVGIALKEIRARAEEVNVAATEESLDLRGSSVRTGFSMSDVSHLAGASETLAGLESHTGTAWRSQEHLHIRGAHQVGYQVNGISIQDLSIFGGITPFIDPRNIKFAEVTTGGLAPEFGNRTAGVVNTLVRSGFDHGLGHGRVEASGGNLSRGSLFANFGNHTSEKFALGSLRGALRSPNEAGHRAAIFIPQPARRVCLLSRKERHGVVWKLRLPVLAAAC
ncbi:MAG TPA: TonB-dependent receptor plug domain-containing protein [Blastocatellia bacterium]